MTFSTDDQRFGEFVTIDLKEDGRNIPVTDENKAEYVQYVFDCHLIQNVGYYVNGEYETESRTN